MLSVNVIWKNWEEKVMPLGLRHSFYVMYSQKIMQQKRILYMNQYYLLKNGDEHLNSWIYMSNKMYQILLFIIKENASAKYKERQKFTLLNEIENYRRLSWRLLYILWKILFCKRLTLNEYLLADVKLLCRYKLLILINNSFYTYRQSNRLYLKQIFGLPISLNHAR